MNFTLRASTPAPAATLKDMAAHLEHILTDLSLVSELPKQFKIFSGTVSSDLIVVKGRFELSCGPGLMQCLEALQQSISHLSFILDLLDE